MRRLALCTGALLLIGCTAIPSLAGSDSSGSSSPLQSPATSCTPIELRTPGGSRVDLTGTWRGRSAVHYVRQLESCVWWFALSDLPGEPAGSAFSISFHGHVRQDFTLVGEWAFVVRPVTPGTPASALEPVTFTIDVDVSGGEEALILLGPGGGIDTGGPVVGFYDAVTLERVGPLPGGR